MPHPTLRPGIYRHFKGGVYEVLGVAQLVDSFDSFVVYRRVGDAEWVIRPESQFTETVEREGRTQPRFQFLQAVPPTNVNTGCGQETIHPPCSAK